MATDEDAVYVHWSEGQQHAIDAVLAGRNVVISGAAGVGKSAVTTYLREELNKRGRKVAVTATTGIAALNVGGKTLHSFLKVGPKIDTMTKDELIKEALARRGFAADMKTYSVLFVDEVSMMSIDFFTKINDILCALRSNWTPFGGLQVVFVGDFAQLPPVRKTAQPLSYAHTIQAVLGVGDKRPRDEDDDDFMGAVLDTMGIVDEPKRRRADEVGDTLPAAKAAPRFIFQHDLFYELFHEVVDLTEVFRQDDPVFIAMLNNLRFGRATPEHMTLLQTRVGTRATLDLGESTDGIEATKLYAKNIDVDSINSTELAKITAPPVVYTMRSGSHVDAGRSHTRDKEGAQKMLNFMLEKLIKDLNAPAAFTLKEGAQVYLTYNLDVEGGLVNGSRGVVVGFSGGAAGGKEGGAHGGETALDLAHARVIREVAVMHEAWANGKSDGKAIKLDKTVGQLAANADEAEDDGDAAGAASIRNTIRKLAMSHGIFPVLEELQVLRKQYNLIANPGPFETICTVEYGDDRIRAQLLDLLSRANDSDAAVQVKDSYDFTCSALEGLYYTPVPAKKAAKPKADPEAKFHTAGADLEEPLAYPAERMPIVLFQGKGGRTRKMEMPYVRWNREEKHLGEVYVWQVPLKLAWATTIHSTCLVFLCFLCSCVCCFCVRL